MMAKGAQVGVASAGSGRVRLVDGEAVEYGGVDKTIGVVRAKGRMQDVSRVAA